MEKEAPITESKSGSLWRKVLRINRSHGRSLLNFEKTAVFQYAVFLTAFGSFIFLGLSFYTLKEEFSDRREERKQRHLERIDAAWNRILLPVGGNIGKGQSINQLLQNGNSITGINLSCTMSKSNTCDNPQIINGIDISNVSNFEQNSKKVLEFLGEDRIIGENIFTIQSTDQFAVFSKINIRSSEIEFENNSDKSRNRELIIEHANLIDSVIRIRNIYGIQITSSKAARSRVLSSHGPVGISNSDVSGAVFQIGTQKQSLAGATGGFVQPNNKQLSLSSSFILARDPPRCTSWASSGTRSAEKGTISASIVSTRVCGQHLLKNLVFCDNQPTEKVRTTDRQSDYGSKRCEFNFAKIAPYSISLEEAVARYGEKYVGYDKMKPFVGSKQD